MAELRYLTVPDLLWLNLELTGNPQTYRFDKLEEVCAYQYGRGTFDPIHQAARLALGWKRQRPFQTGNDACGFVSVHAFLMANDLPVEMDDVSGAAWWSSLPTDSVTLASELRAMSRQGHIHDYHNVVDYREILGGIIRQYAESLAALNAAEQPAAMRDMARTRLTGELIR
ncbi:MAG: hypothetical protein KF812_06585 [Fimbriimonadaceae bacterium]|nr:hypothetical protein [Fimbriimonadaceae bacterium]